MMKVQIALLGGLLILSTGYISPIREVNDDVLFEDTEAQVKFIERDTHHPMMVGAGPCGPATIAIFKTNNLYKIDNGKRTSLNCLEAHRRQFNNESSRRLRIRKIGDAYYAVFIRGINFKDRTKSYDISLLKLENRKCREAIHLKMKSKDGSFPSIEEKEPDRGILPQWKVRGSGDLG